MIYFKLNPMARLPRLTLPGYPHHVLQRGNNRQAIFISSQDHQAFLEFLQESSRAFEVEVHAYVLMDNHFPLLVTPRTGSGFSQLIKNLKRN